MGSLCLFQVMKELSADYYLQHTLRFQKTVFICPDFVFITRQFLHAFPEGNSQF